MIPANLIHTGVHTFPSHMLPRLLSLRILVPIRPPLQLLITLLSCCHPHCCCICLNIVYRTSPVPARCRCHYCHHCFLFEHIERVFFMITGSPVTHAGPR